MWRRAAALPLINFAGFELREERRGAERLERRRVRFDAALEEREPLRVRRRRPRLGKKDEFTFGHPFIHDISFPC